MLLFVSLPLYFKNPDSQNFVLRFYHMLVVLVRPYHERYRLRILAGRPIKSGLSPGFMLQIYAFPLAVVAEFVQQMDSEGDLI